MTDFKVGDKVILKKPQQPFPDHWPVVTGYYACGWLETTWDRHHGKIHIVEGFYDPQGYHRVELTLKLDPTQQGPWPIECIFPVDDKGPESDPLRLPLKSNFGSGMRQEGSLLMADFKVGDKVMLRKPQAPFPEHWPTCNYGDTFAFDKYETTWDRCQGGPHTIVSMAEFRGCTAVQLESLLNSGQKLYSWPIECIFPDDTASAQIPCNCPMNLILSQGCTKKDHY